MRQLWTSISNNQLLKAKGGSWCSIRGNLQARIGGGPQSQGPYPNREMTENIHKTEELEGVPNNQVAMVSFHNKEVTQIRN